MKILRAIAGVVALNAGGVLIYNSLHSRAAAARTMGRRDGPEHPRLPDLPARPMTYPHELSATQWHAYRMLRESWAGYITLADIRRIGGNIRTAKALISAEIAELIPGERLAYILPEKDLERLFPVDRGTVSCGLLTDLPKKQRRHKWLYFGRDMTNKGTEGICETEVFACIRCGKDKR